MREQQAQRRNHLLGVRRPFLVLAHAVHAEKSDKADHAYTNEGEYETDVCLSLRRPAVRPKVGRGNEFCEKTHGL